MRVKNMHGLIDMASTCQGVDDSPVKCAVKSMRRFWNTYEDQKGYENYTYKTFLDDALYAIGISIDERYEFAGGFDQFKKFLIDYLQREQEGYDRRFREQLKSNKFKDAM